MTLGGVSDHFLQLCVSYEDLQLIELRIRVVHGEWSAVSTAYVSRSFLAENGEAILWWIEAPNEPLNIEAGGDTGIGWMLLQLYTIDRAGPRPMCRETGCNDADGRSTSCQDITILH
jgi:hypothetical protein